MLKTPYETLKMGLTKSSIYLQLPTLGDHLRWVAAGRSRDGVFGDILSRFIRMVIMLEAGETTHASLNEVTLEDHTRPNRPTCLRGL
jgi:hypothetical protein